MNKNKSYKIKVLLVLVSLFLTFLCFEIFFRFVFFDSDTRSLGAKSVYDKVTNFSKSKHHAYCWGESSFHIHPYFGFVLDPTTACNENSTNKDGFKSPREFPLENPKDSFDILVLGGSVAHNLAAGYNYYKPPWRNEIEELLNKEYLVPEGTQFKIYNGSMPAGSLPLQTSVLITYLSSFDGVISIDGYNEMIGTKDMKLGAPPIGTLTESMYSYLKVKRRFPFISTAHFLKKIDPLESSFLVAWVYRSLISIGLKNKFKDLYNEDNFFFRIYKKPSEWSHKKLDQWNINRFVEFVKMEEALCKRFNVKFAHFLQPNRFFYKELTSEEKSYVKFSREDFYKGLDQALSKERVQGLSTYSLLKVFENEKGTIYGDYIHSKQEESGYSKGRDLISQAIVKEIAQKWGLKKAPSL